MNISRDLPLSQLYRAPMDADDVRRQLHAYSWLRMKAIRRYYVRVKARCRRERISHQTGIDTPRLPDMLPPGDTDVSPANL